MAIAENCEWGLRKASLHSQFLWGITAITTKKLPYLETRHRKYATVWF